MPPFSNRLSRVSLLALALCLSIHISEAGSADTLRDDRPECVAAVSGLYDLSDNDPDPVHGDDPGYWEPIQNYTYSCVRVGSGGGRDQKQFSPVALINSATKDLFKPMFLMHAVNDGVVPVRQLFDMQCGLNNAGVDPCAFQIAEVTDGSLNAEHGFPLLRATDPNNPSQTLMDSVLIFLHTHLD